VVRGWKGKGWGRVRGWKGKGWGGGLRGWGVQRSMIIGVLPAGAVVSVLGQ